MTHEAVVIAGAGPTGLLLAIELALAGAKPIVLERLPAPDLTPKAGGLGVLAAEVLERRGLGPAMAAAEAATNARILQHVKPGGAGASSSPAKPAFPRRPGGHFSGLPLIDLEMQRDPERRMRGVVQADLEAMLGDRAAALGVAIRRGVELVDFAETPDGIDVRTRETSGTSDLETIHARYLVGCDGGRSHVRKHAGFDFPGTAPTFTGWRAELELDAPEKLQPGWARTDRGVVRYGPIPGQLFLMRFDGPKPDRDAPITRDEIEDALRHVSGIPDLTVTAVKTATRFTDNARQATTYRKGRVFLAGDAAHVHSAFGGQGLNLGLVDAANLGFKLARVLKGDLESSAAEALLDSYTRERHPVGARVLANTRAQVALIRPDPMTTALREIMTDLMHLEPANRLIGELTSGVATRYDLGDDDPRVGTLAKNLRLELESGETRDLYDVMQNGGAVLLEPTPLESEDAKRLERLERLTRIRTRTGPAMLLRPDACIAWASDGAADARLAKALLTCG